MYKHLTSQQRSQIFALLQIKTTKNEIVQIIGCSESTVYREIKRNSTEKGNYLWEKVHAQALERRKRMITNSSLDSVLIWRIKQMILEAELSPVQIKGALTKEGISVSIQTIYNIIK